MNLKYIGIFNYIHRRHDIYDTKKPSSLHKNLFKPIFEKVYNNQCNRGGKLKMMLQKIVSL